MGKYCIGEIDLPVSRLVEPVAQYFLNYQMKWSRNLTTFFVCYENILRQVGENQIAVLVCHE